MDFFKVLNTRHSTRTFTSQPVEQEKQEAILAAANQAPSAGNLQAYEIYAVTNPACRQALALAAWYQDFVAEATFVLVFCAHPVRSAMKYGQRGVDLYCLQDATIACVYAQLAATALGLGSVWVGAFEERAVRAAIGASEGLLPVAILPIGYAGETPRIRGRRSLSSLVHKID